MLNSSLKSEFRAIAPFSLMRKNDQFPGGFKSGCGVLTLPVLNIERAVKVFNTSETFHNKIRLLRICFFSHTLNFIPEHRAEGELLF